MPLYRRKSWAELTPLSQQLYAQDHGMTQEEYDALPLNPKTGPRIKPRKPRASLKRATDTWPGKP
jgi:hypothetical protein